MNTGENQIVVYLRKREGGSMKFNSGEVGRVKGSAFAEDVNARSLV